jgi:hypothetical protein
MSLIKVKKVRINDLGIKLSRFANLEANNILMHEDISAWGAPGECHQDVHKGFEVNWMKLEQEVGSFSFLMKEAGKRVHGNCMKGYEHAVSKIVQRNYMW